MIYSVVGTHNDIREKAIREFSDMGEVTEYIYSEQAGELKRHVDAISLFGDTIIITCVQLGDVASSKEVLVDLLPEMEQSATIFIIDEPFADIHLSNKLRKVSSKFFDAKEEKVKDTNVFALCDAFAKRDKKTAWILFMHIRSQGEGEAVAGALWWKFQTLWQGVKAGRKSAFTLTDCERIGGDIVRASILAHRGERDLMSEIERIILSL